jgi:hypothetical protein
VTGLALIVAACSLLLIAQASSQTAKPISDSHSLSEAEVIQRIDGAVSFRTSHISGYSVKELYSIYRNGDPSPAAQVTVKTIYNRTSGKEYTPVSQTGSSMLRNIVIEKILANEKEMARTENHDKVAITSANYEMHLLPGKVTINGRDCVVVTLKARRKLSYLLNGKGWFDAGDYTLVHLEGSPAQSVSVFAGETAGKRDYDRIQGFSMAKYAELHSHSFLFGNTALKIDYSEYKIDIDPNAPGAQKAP